MEVYREYKIGESPIILHIEYNVDSHIAFGTQVEISNNFYANYNKFYVCSTIAACWTL